MWEGTVAPWQLILVTSRDIIVTAGIYALMSFTVQQRSREIGIRVALGAEPRAIVKSVFSRAFMQIGLGIVAGGAIVSLTMLKSPADVKLVAMIALLMMTFGLIGSMIPAARALRIQPTSALRATRQRPSSRRR